MGSAAPKRRRRGARGAAGLISVRPSPPPRRRRLRRDSLWPGAPFWAATPENEALVTVPAAPYTKATAPPTPQAEVVLTKVPAGTCVWRQPEERCQLPHGVDAAPRRVARASPLQRNDCAGHDSLVGREGAGWEGAHS